MWGASFLFIKIAVEGLSPGQVVLGRLLGGAVLLALIMTVTRRRWPTGTRTWSHFFALGILMCVAPFLLFSWAAQHLPSGVSSIFNATTPIATMVIALAVLPEERLTRIRTTAMIIAAGGSSSSSGRGDSWRTCRTRTSRPNWHAWAPRPATGWDSPTPGVSSGPTAVTPPRSLPARSAPAPW
ncbi:EamA family transporter [Kocuria kalidii]|uniref:DMT family transporter n=1 Tax=Kocuria kalidii TaxID=3376283 RepID=UPI0037BD9827